MGKGLMKSDIGRCALLLECVSLKITTSAWGVVSVIQPIQSYICPLLLMNTLAQEVEFFFQISNLHNIFYVSTIHKVLQVPHIQKLGS